MQRRARAWIDLNRSEAERDPAIDSGVCAKTMPAPSAKLRGGLGLVPRRVGSIGDIWRRKLDGEEVDARITGDHRPYHAALATMLARADRRTAPAMLLAYEALRRERVAAVQRGARQNGLRYDSLYADLAVRDAEIAAHASFRRWLYDHDVVPEAKAAIADLP